MNDALTGFETIEQMAELRTKRLDELKTLDERMTELQVAPEGETDEARAVRDASVTEAEARWTSLQAEVEDLDKRIEAREQRTEFLNRQRKDPSKVEPAEDRKTNTPATSRIPEDVHDLYAYRQNSRSMADEAVLTRDGALKILETAEFPAAQGLTSKRTGLEYEGHSREDIQGHIEGMLRTNSLSERVNPVSLELARRIVVTGDPVYKRAFAKAAIGDALSTDEQNVLAGGSERALSVGTTTAGGFAIVYELDPTIVHTSNSVVNPWRALARIVNIAGTNEWRQATSGAITAAYGAEAVEATDNTPTLAQAAIIAEKASAFVPFSVEIEGDAEGLMADLAVLFADAKDDLESTQFATGAGHGSTAPKGVITGASTTVGTTTTAAFVIADVYKLFEQLPPRFRPRAQFAANLFIIDKVRQFDTSGGSGVYIGPQGLQPGADAGDFGAVNQGLSAPLLGRRFWEASAMASVLTTTSKIMIVGDFRHFIIVDRVGMNVELVPMLTGTVANYPTGQRGMYAWWRNSSDVDTAAAFRVLVT